MILLYHRITRLEADPHSLAVDPARFEAHLDLLTTRYRPVRLSRMIEGIDGTLPKNAVAVTFDDGYADNLLEARPRLEAAGIPATVFISTGRLDGSGEFWWDELEQLVLSPDPLPAVFDATIAGTRLKMSMQEDGPRSGAAESGRGAGGSSAREILFHELLRLLRRVEALERDRLFDAFWGWAGRNPAVRDSHRPLADPEVVDLVAGGLVEIGAHTVSHPGLSRLPPSARTAEIADSRRHLESLVDGPVLDFAYPFGDRRRSRAAVRRCGLRSACTTRPGRITSRTDPHRLPRVRVGDWDAERLAKTLESVSCHDQRI